VSVKDLATFEQTEISVEALLASGGGGGGGAPAAGQAP